MAQPSPGLTHVPSPPNAGIPNDTHGHIHGGPREAETKTGVNPDITEMTDPQANHYKATTSINVKIMEALGERMTEGALQPSHITM